MVSRARGTWFREYGVRGYRVTLWACGVEDRVTISMTMNDATDYESVNESICQCPMHGVRLEV